MYAEVLVLGTHLVELLFGSLGGYADTPTPTTEVVQRFLTSPHGLHAVAHGVVEGGIG